jgi:hypothetical protein
MMLSDEGQAQRHLSGFVRESLWFWQIVSVACRHCLFCLDGAHTTPNCPHRPSPEDAAPVYRLISSIAHIQSLTVEVEVESRRLLRDAHNLSMLEMGSQFLGHPLYHALNHIFPNRLITGQFQAHRLAVLDGK